MNKFTAVIFLLLMLCGSALWYLASGSLEVHAKNQIEQISSQILQRAVSVKEVLVEPEKGIAEISNFQISRELNKGSDTFISIDKISTKFSPESMYQKQRIIESIELSGFKIYTEKLNSTELVALLKTVKLNIEEQKQIKPTSRSKKQPVYQLTSIFSETVRLGKTNHVVLSPLNVTNFKNEESQYINLFSALIMRRILEELIAKTEAGLAQKPQIQSE